MTPADFKAARRELGLSQNALAARMGIADRTIRRWEKGTVPIPGPVIVLMGYFARDDAWLPDDRTASEATTTDNRPTGGSEQ